MTEQSRSAPFVPVPAGRCVPRWLEPLRPALPELTVTDWSGLEEFETTLRELLVHPSRHRMAQPGRSTALLAVRRHLAQLTARQASAGQLVQGDDVRADLRQTARQIICGFYDLDQRDASGPGHGRMILRHGSPACRQRWAPRLRAGELAGIAMTEAVGGTQVHAIITALVPAVSGGWRVTGEKRWISRLDEASVFVVFARTPDQRITAVAVDATAPGITRHPEQPSGLSGWSWGRLLFDAVPVAVGDVLSRRGFDGLAVFVEHFAHYRSLVTATALGTAAAVHDAVAAHLAARERRGEIGRVRDHALITVGRAHAKINSVCSPRCTPSDSPPPPIRRRRCGDAVPRPSVSTWPARPPMSCRCWSARPDSPPGTICRRPGATSTRSATPTACMTVSTAPPAAICSPRAHLPKPPLPPWKDLQPMSQPGTLS